MPTFEISTSDGHKYHVDAPTGDAAYAALSSVLGTTSKMTDPNAPRPGVAESIGRGAAAGATFNTYDELAGLAAASGNRQPIEGPAPTGPGAFLTGGIRGGADEPMHAWDLIKGGYKLLTGDTEAKQRAEAETIKQREANQAAQQANPWSYGGGEVIGMLPSVLAGGAAGGAIRASVEGASPVVNALGRGAASTLSGTAGEGAGLAARGTALASSGTLYGAAAGAGGADEGDRLAGAAKGAALGAALAPAAGAVGAGLGWLGRRVTGIVAPAERAFGAVRDAGEAAGTDWGAVADRLEAGQARGQPVTAADVAGEKVRALAGIVTRKGDAASEDAQRLLRERQTGADPMAITTQAPPPGGVTPPGSSQGQRLTDALTTFMGDDARGSLAAHDQLSAHQDMLSTPAYDKVRAATIPPVDQLEIEQNLVPRLKRTGVYDEALHNMAVDGTPVDFSQVEPWDRMKRALDDQISGAKTAQQNEKVRSLTRLKGELTASIDDVVPEYAQARQIYAGPAAVKDALELGGDVLKKNTEVVAHEYRTLDTASERQAYRLGAVNALKDSVSRYPDAGDKAKLLMGNNAIRTKIATIAPDEASRIELFNHLGNESEMFQTRASTVGNSATAGRVAADQAYEQGPIEALHGVAAAGAAAGGHFHPAIGWIVKQMSKIDPAQRQAVLQHINDIILNPDPARIRAFADQVMQANMPNGTRQRVISGVRTLLRTLPRAVTTGGTQQ